MSEKFMVENTEKTVNDTKVELKFYKFSTDGLNCEFIAATSLKAAIYYQVACDYKDIVTFLENYPDVEVISANELKNIEVFDEDLGKKVTALDIVERELQDGFTGTFGIHTHE